MKQKMMVAIVFALVLALGLGGTALAQTAAEEPAPTTFTISAAHMVQGNQIGLTAETPVFVGISRNGQLLASVPMVYMQRIQAELPAGVYELTFTDQLTGNLLFSCGPYDIPAGVSVRLQAHEKGPGRIPACYVRVMD